MEVSGLERSFRELGNVRKDRLKQEPLELSALGEAVLIHVICEVRVPFVKTVI